MLQGSPVAPAVLPGFLFGLTRCNRPGNHSLRNQDGKIVALAPTTEYPQGAGGSCFPAFLICTLIGFSVHVYILCHEQSLDQPSFRLTWLSESNIVCISGSMIFNLLPHAGPRQLQALRIPHACHPPASRTCLGFKVTEVCPLRCLPSPPPFGVQDLGPFNEAILHTASSVRPWRAARRSNLAQEEQKPTTQGPHLSKSSLCLHRSWPLPMPPASSQPKDDSNGRPMPPHGRPTSLHVAQAQMGRSPATYFRPFCLFSDCSLTWGPVEFPRLANVN
ncbi:hypothetical protein BDP55DRAFT_190579 [Colletotrichum godetiae]|uniref:Uncharacterized protein n=1 Tax=Colletotrichum godetiae TaxID=1209918 RepID=A0AAJ0EWG9_9PEZI|nr:uncharacterized protein BDP55DRAFT_190579 [Colletotrichum godetiae]KAK1674215.1 hypothetical protein BDP55DRAFT_190579 [Colletotrichum godetiae]